MKLSHILIAGASAALTIALAGCYINTAGPQPAQQPAAPTAQPTQAAQPVAQPTQTTPPKKKSIGKWGSKAKPKTSASATAAPSSSVESPSGKPRIIPVGVH